VDVNAIVGPLFQLLAVIAVLAIGVRVVRELLDEGSRTAEGPDDD